MSDGGIKATILLEYCRSFIVICIIFIHDGKSVHRILSDVKTGIVLTCFLIWSGDYLSNLMSSEYSLIRHVNILQ